MPEIDDRAIFTHELHIDASADTVYSYFTDPTKMATWMGVDHKLDPIRGGVFRVDINGRDVAVGQFVRLRLLPAANRKYGRRAPRVGQAVTTRLRVRER